MCEISADRLTDNATSASFYGNHRRNRTRGARQAEKDSNREIMIDNGRTVKIGRGLTFTQKPDGWFSIGANDLALRRCLETKVDIFRH
jgi:hypothetical protein